MFLVVLLVLSSLMTSCSNKDKAANDNLAAYPEVKAVTTSSTIADAQETKTQEKKNSKIFLKVDKASPKINVKVDQGRVTEIESPNVDQEVIATTAKAAAVNVTQTIIVDEAEDKPAIKAPANGSSHAEFNALLQKHVSNGLVNYEGFKADATKFDKYLEYLSTHAPSTSDKSKAALAFWMNAYNAFTIKLIVDNLPVASIMDLDGGKVWDRKWIKIGDQTMSLNGIEHDIIRPVFNEPRIHFAVVCAAKSCPPLDSKAFMADTVDAHLERLTKSFINNPKFNTLTESKITITPIMDWYAKDFGDVRAYVQKYATTSVGDKAKIKFTDYDWSLNGK